MTTALQTIHDALPLLRAQYAGRLRLQSGELLDFISRCERGRLSDEALEEARLLAHSLCGTGSTFGFPEISDTARYLETALDCGLTREPATYIDLALKLVKACDNAAKAIEGQCASGAIPPAADSLDAETTEKPCTLFVHADETTIAVMRELLRPQTDLLTASNPNEAAQTLTMRKPAVVVFDMRANDPSITTSLEAVYEEARTEGLPMIALVASRKAAAVAHAISDGAIQCIIGPSCYEKLYDGVRAILERDRRVVLIGDDDTIVRNIIANRFRMHGFSVLGACDGPQVVDLAARHRPSIIVLDRIMPGPDGVAVLQMLKANPATRDIPVVMLTSKRRALEIKEARSAGAAEYIVKPFRPEHVVSTCMHELGLAS
jgi:CheY-like chemotaxis protein